MWRVGLFLVGAWWACGFSTAALAAEVRVAVAANFAAPLAALAPGFATSTGHSLKISNGATGKFYTQIQAGAPFDVLLAADEATPAKLAQEGHALAASQFTYAMGRLVLWSATPGLVDATGAVLGRGDFRYLAMANPKTAPYGRAAMQVLKHLALTEALRRKWVVGESVAQAYQFVATGNAELGFVALSQLPLKQGRPDPDAAGSFWLVPASMHEPLRQDAVLLKAGANNPAATALLTYLKTDAARRVLQDFGYGLSTPMVNVQR
jgi:molybdate transport system substrate-binding protein